MHLSVLLKRVELLIWQAQNTVTVFFETRRKHTTNCSAARVNLAIVRSIYCCFLFFLWNAFIFILFTCCTSLFFPLRISHQSNRVYLNVLQQKVCKKTARRVVCTWMLCITFSIKMNFLNFIYCFTVKFWKCKVSISIYLLHYTAAKLVSKNQYYVNLLKPKSVTTT